MDRACRPRTCLPRLEEVSTVGPDQTRQIVGSSPYPGDDNNTGIRIPALPSDPDKRYLIRLAGYRLGPRARSTLWGIRQYLSIGTLLDIGREEPICRYFIEREVTSPLWAFQDGNVSWHLRVVPIDENYDAFDGGAVGQPPGFSPARHAQSSVILYQPPFVAGTYTPPNVGIPPDAGIVGDLDTFRDLRFPWRTANAQWALAYDIEGPCDVIFFASVKQTNPVTRCSLGGRTFVADPAIVAAALPPEEAFLLVFPDAIFWRIAGALIYEITEKDK